MERAWRLDQYTRKMDSSRNAIVCRHFINGSCRFGSRCRFRHDWSATRSSQICRYYLKGICRYGERCRYIHVPQPNTETAVEGRRASVPVVSTVGCAPSDRRGSEPAVLQAVTSGQECSELESLDNGSNPQLDTGHLSANATEQSQESEQESVQRSGGSETGAGDGRNEGTTSSEALEDGAAAACSAQRSEEETEAFLQSKDLICGICMDKVYEKIEPGSNVFGILPNCNHPFCLQCISTWRKTRDLGLDLIKTCPQCRVRSAFYVPNKYWVEGQAKEKLIAEFKEQFSNKCCSYYTQYGCCPFTTECLYRHDKSVPATSFLHLEADDHEGGEDDGSDVIRFFIAMTLYGDTDYDLGLNFLLY